MSRGVHVRFWESVGVRFSRATHLPLYRQEPSPSRSGLCTPARSTLAQCGVQLQPLLDALTTELLRSRACADGDRWQRDALLAAFSMAPIVDVSVEDR